MTSVHLRLAPLAIACATAFTPLSAAEIEPGLRTTAMQAGTVDTLIVLTAKAPKHLLRTDGTYLERRRNLVDTLRATADVTQAELRAWLDAQGVAYRPFWIVNMIEAALTPAQLDALALREDVAKVESNRAFSLKQPPGPQPDGQAPGELPAAALAIEWGVNKVRAPLVWAAGFTGQGVVVAGQDTGIRWTHAAIKSKYRGWNGVAPTTISTGTTLFMTPAAVAVRIRWCLATITAMAVIPLAPWSGMMVAATR